MYRLELASLLKQDCAVKVKAALEILEKWKSDSKAVGQESLQHLIQGLETLVGSPKSNERTHADKNQETSSRANHQE